MCVVVVTVSVNVNFSLFLFNRQVVNVMKKSFFCCWIWWLMPTADVNSTVPLLQYYTLRIFVDHCTPSIAKGIHK